jgi:hypothetical protein
MQRPVRSGLHPQPGSRAGEPDELCGLPGSGRRAIPRTTGSRAPCMQASDASPSKLSEALGHICGVNSNLDDVWAAATEVSKPTTVRIGQRQSSDSQRAMNVSTASPPTCRARSTLRASYSSSPSCCWQGGSGCDIRANASPRLPSPTSAQDKERIMSHLIDKDFVNPLDCRRRRRKCAVGSAWQRMG